MRMADDYTLEQYKVDVAQMGLAAVWDDILGEMRAGRRFQGILVPGNLGELYEIGLAVSNKSNKKELGKYFTPDDVACVMAEWLAGLEGDAVCDVCCGTGNLILAYLRFIGETRAKQLISAGKVHLYDLDSVALETCKTLIGLEYGHDIAEHVRCVAGDFLSRDISLPPNCKVISNPPYARFCDASATWDRTEVVLSSKELYAAIAEKVFVQSRSAVIITPYSFIGGSKFYALRRVMNDHDGFIVCFDNVPANIFKGRKHGVFNTNAANSTRAAITVMEDKGGAKGFRCSSLIRFRAAEREQVLNADALMTLVGNRHQVVDDANTRYMKCHPTLEGILEAWLAKADGHVISERIADDGGGFPICFSSTGRYFTVGTVRDLERSSKDVYRFATEDEFHYAYCLFNSSFCYWHWRVYDGGFTYPKSLVREIPDLYRVLTARQKRELAAIAEEMISREGEFLVYKKNAGKDQESAKFPIEYRKRINQVFLDAIGADVDESVFDAVHANSAF